MTAARRTYADYRRSPRFIRNGTILCFVSMGVMLALGIGICVYSGSVEDSARQETLIQVGIWTAAGGGLLVPLLIVAVLGGLAVHRLGWIPGLLVGLGLISAVAGKFLIGTVPLVIGIAAVVVGTIVFVYLGIRSNVPVFFRAPTSLGGSQVRLNRPKQSVEDEPGTDAPRSDLR